MAIHFDEAEMQAIAAKAIFDSLTPDARDEIMQKVMRELMTKKTGYGYKETTPLEQAYQEASTSVVKKIAQERLAADPTFAENINKLFDDVTRKLFESDLRQKLVDTMADSVITGLKSDRY